MKGNLYIITDDKIHKEELIILNLYAQNHIVYRYKKQKLTEL